VRYDIAQIEVDLIRTSLETFSKVFTQRDWVGSWILVRGPFGIAEIYGPRGEKLA
jgi:hypothetical protein